MLKEIIIGKLKEAGKPIQPSGKGFIITSCLNPQHQDKHPSFSVNLENGYGVCFSCNYKVNKKYWLYGVEDEELVDELMRAALYKNMESYYEDKEVSTPELFFPPRSEKELPNPWRGLTKDTLDKYNIYYCDMGHFEDRIIFPMRDSSENLVAFNTRAMGDIKEGMQKYKYSKGIPVNSLVYPPIPKGTKEVVLCEGIMDALSMAQAGIPAMFNFGVNYTFSPKKISHLLRMGVETIYLAFDNDDAGDKAVVTYMQSELSDYFVLKHGRLCKALVPFYISEAKDFNEFITRKDNGC